jgi:hypothetical protein
MDTRIMVSGWVVVASSQLAMTQELPKWDIPEICANESAPGQCALFEGRARNAISGSWDVLPEAVKKRCFDSVKTPLDQSWRLLGYCIEAETLKGVNRRAVATAATPAEPVTPPQRAASATGEPAPLFGMPAAPPKSP